MLRCTTLCAALAALGFAPAASGDDDLGGFGEDESFEYELEEEPGAGSIAEANRWWEVDGNVGVSSSVNYLSHSSATGDDFTGVSRLRARLNLELDAQLPYDWKLRVSPYIWYDLSYVINGIDNFTRVMLRDYEWEGDFQDSYLQGRVFEDLDLKIGRQVVNWGRSDSVRVLDVLNPLDNREPGRADIEDLRRSIGMVKADYYVGDHWTVTGVVIPEIRFDDLPPPGSDFNPSAVNGPPERRPDDFEDPEYAFAVRGIFTGWDVSLHYAQVFQDFPRVKLLGPPPGPMLPPPTALVHDRIQVMGGGANYTTGSWLFKTEVAGIEGIGFFSDPGDEYWRVDAMGGIEYYGIQEGTVALEIVNRHLVGHHDRFQRAPDSTREDSLTYALRYTQDWLNARLSTTVLALVLGWKAQDGAILRAQADYDLRDGLVLTGGILIFQGGKLPPTSSWGHNDRLFFDVKYSF